MIEFIDDQTIQIIPENKEKDMPLPPLPKLSHLALIDEDGNEVKKFDFSSVVYNQSALFEVPCQESLERYERMALALVRDILAKINIYRG